ncbi:4881_t:CDS:1, partial [Racocetra fulgida]
LSSPEAQYQEVEIMEDDCIYDILRKMDRLYLLPYKVTILVTPNNKFNSKETITTTTELNAWDICFSHDFSQPKCQFFGFLVQNMDHHYATLIEFCRKCNR